MTQFITDTHKAFYDSDWVINLSYKLEHFQIWFLYKRELRIFIVKQFKKRQYLLHYINQIRVYKVNQTPLPPPNLPPLENNPKIIYIYNTYIIGGTVTWNYNKSSFKEKSLFFFNLILLSLDMLWILRYTPPPFYLFRRNVSLPPPPPLFPDFYHPGLHLKKL